MNDLTRQSDRIVSDARALVADNRAGGRHRREGSIGKGSQQLKLKNTLRRAGYFGVAILAILAATTAVGLVIGGIGFAGIMIVIFAMIAAGVLFANFPKVKTPKRADLTKGDVRQMVGKTELWLEAQRPALPPPAAAVVSDMGVQLDALGLQLEGVEPNHPAAREVRKLVGEHLPEMVDSYRRIPEHLRREENAGTTPDAQLTENLKRISGEIDSVTRQLAAGDIDNLAVKGRYLEYRYGAGPEESQ